MSSTRHVESGERRRQNGWASASEFDVLRGLNGTAVAFKAALQDDPANRELLYFLQALSLRDGGLKRIARELVEMFPERIGTPTMHKIGCRPGKHFAREQCREIAKELYANQYTKLDLLCQEADAGEEPFYLRTAEEFIAECRSQAEQLDQYIEELCCNPKIEVTSDRSTSSKSYRNKLAAALDEDVSWNFGTADVHYFDDVLGALFEYQRRHTERGCADYVETSIGKIVFEAMDYVLETGRPALIEGNSGFGKTTALMAKCDMHLGRMRFMQLTGITTRTTFFRTAARVCGVASGGMSSGKVQARVEDFLRRTKLILVIDEGQYLWPQGKRIESHPELINWLNTACYNEGVPFVISATKQFTLRRQAVEKSTDWSSEQSRRRTRRTFPLPDAPTTKDLEAVARKLLGELGENANAVDLAVGYALTSRGYFQSINDAIDDARLIAKRAGRDRITFKDLKAAIYEWRAPSDAALQRVFDSKPEVRRRRQVAPAQTDFESGADETTHDEPAPVDRLRGGPRVLRSAPPELVGAGDG